jgi:hypothetical protein
MSPTRLEKLAAALLRQQGFAVRDRGDCGLIWNAVAGDRAPRPGDDVRTLTVVEYCRVPRIVRLAIDYYDVRFPWRNEMAHPSRPGAELTILPDEVEAMLPWALSFDKRTGTSQVPVPDIRGDSPRQSPGEYWPASWTYGWSARAAHAYEMHRGEPRVACATLSA